MFEYEDEGLSTEEGKNRTWIIRIVAVILLIALLCGVVAAPLTVYLRWQRNQAAQSVNEPLITIQKPAAPFSRLSRIALINPDDQLVTISADGNDIRQLTDSDLHYQFPAWSPDGHRLAVIGGDSLYLFPDEEGAGDGDLAARPYSDASRPPFYLYWSPDGSQLTFLTNHPNGIALYLASAGDNEIKELAVGQPFYWDWDPAAKEILIHAGTADNESKLALLNTSGTERISNIADPGQFQAPGISRSGKHWAYAETTDEGVSRVVVQDIDGAVKLVEPHIGQVFLTWSPVSEKLAYSSPRFGSQSRFGPLKLFQMESGSTSTLVSDQVIAYFWSPDGTKIAYLTLAEQGPGGTQAINFEDKSIRRARLQDRHPEIRLNLWVVDINVGDIRWLAEFEPPAIFVAQFLPFFDQYALSHRLWSPDSQSLVMPIVNDEKSMISIISVDEGDIREIIEGKIAFWSPY